MKAAATLMAGTALAASVGLHLTGFTMMPTSEVQIEGGAPMQLAMLGNSFADMTQGTITPVTTQENEPAKTPPAEISSPVTPPDLAQTPPPAQKPTQSAPVVAQSLNNPVVPMLAAIAPAKPLETLTSKAPVEVQPVKPGTRRPATRPAKPTAARPKPTTPRRQQAVAPLKPQAAAPPKPQGGTQAARRGQTDGSAAGKAATRGQGATRTRAAGNAAASNYPGLVMRKISRVRKQRAGARGKATVGFKISTSGAATSVRIIRSSGSAKVDKVALRHIQRASPFPRPPKGARRSFSVVFVSKS